MTSRRSRLKAVTNLPVRRKAVSSQGSADEAISADNLTPAKAYSCSEKSNFASVSNTKKDYAISEKEIHKNEKILTKNISEVHVEENGIAGKVINEYNEVEISRTLTNTFGEATNLPVSKTDYSNNSFKSNQYFQPNLISNNEGNENQGLEANRGKEISNELNCINEKIISNNSINNSKNNSSYDNYSESNSGNNIILEDGNKCYTVLTTQNGTLPPLSEYTITPLTPCENTYNSPNVSDDYPAQEYEEVHLYTTIEDNELYVNEESVVETEPSEPILIKISNNSSKNEINKIQINFENLDSNFVEPQNEALKSGLKSKIKDFKSNFSERGENYRNQCLQTKDTHSSKNLITSSSHISGDIHLQKQYISTTRRKRSKCNDFTKKLADAKKEFQKKYEKTKPDRSSLKMIDLIFYNPATNPMESKNKFEKKDESIVSSSDVISNLLEEEKVDEPAALDHNLRTPMPDSYETENINKMPVPQVKIGLDGEIILDEKSIVIETTEAKKGREELLNSAPVFEERGCRVSYYRAKSRKSRDWTDFETKRFYKALNTIGPDFSLMQKYFPKRSRLELKNKFKREEKLNRNLIDKALNNPSEFDMTELEKDLAVEKEAEEEEIETRLCRIVKHNTKKPRIRSSVLSREMVESEGDFENSGSKSSEANSKRLIESDKSKKKLEFDFVLQKLLMKD